MTTDQQVIVGTMAFIIIAMLVGIWNNAPLYDERYHPFRVGFFIFWFVLLTNPNGALSGKALRKYAIKSKYD